MNGHSFLNISNNWLLHTATHLFTKSVSCRSAKFTTRDFEWISKVWAVIYLDVNEDCAPHTCVFQERERGDRVTASDDKVTSMTGMEQAALTTKPNAETFTFEKWVFYKNIYLFIQTTDPYKWILDTKLYSLNYKILHTKW